MDDATGKLEFVDWLISEIETSTADVAGFARPVFVTILRRISIADIDNKEKKHGGKKKDKNRG